MHPLEEFPIFQNKKILLIYNYIYLQKLVSTNLGKEDNGFQEVDLEVSRTDHYHHCNTVLKFAASSDMSYQTLFVSKWSLRVPSL